MKGSKYSAAPASLPLELTSPALLSPTVYTHQYCLQPSPKLSYLAHKPYFRVDTTGAETTWSQNLCSSLPQGKVTTLWQVRHSSCQSAPNQSALRKVTGHSTPKSKLDSPIQALSWLHSKWSLRSSPEGALLGRVYVHVLHSFILGRFLAHHFILLVGSQHPKGDSWGNCGSTKIILVEIQQLVPKGTRKKEKWEMGVREELNG